MEEEIINDNSSSETLVDITPVIAKLDMCTDLLVIQNIFICAIIVFIMCKYAMGGYKNR